MVRKVSSFLKRIAVIGLAGSLLAGCIEDDFAENITSENKLVTEGKQVTITFHSSGGDGAMESIQVPAGSFMTLPQNTYSKEGQIFEGWSLTDFQIVTYLDNGIINAGEENIDLYAVWREALEYQVFFNSNDGIGTMPPMTLLEGSALEIPENIFSKSDYYFSGWAIGENGESTYADKEKLIMPAKNLNLYAVWSLIPVYSITFAANQGTGSMETIFLKEGTSASLPASAFARNGYSFAGWSYETNTAIELANEDLVDSLTQDITLYARWTPNEYEIAFKPEGAAGSMNNLPYVYGDTLVLPESPFIKTGYYLAGWATEQAGSVVYADQAQIVVNSMALELFAVWRPNTYTITFSANGGSGSMSQQAYSYNTLFSLAENGFSKADYDFAGWATDPNGAVVYLNAVEVQLTEINESLHAVWTPKWTGIKTLASNRSIASMESDYNGNVYAIGRSDNLFKAFFITKYDTSGNVELDISVGGSSYDRHYSQCITVDNQGNMIIVGYTSSAQLNGVNRVCGTGCYDSFVIKYDPTGTPLWTKRFSDVGSTRNQKASSVALDSNDNIYVAGPVSNNSPFVIKYSPTGNKLWQKVIETENKTRSDYSAFNSVRSITVDSNNEIIIVGYTDGHYDNIRSQSTQDAFITKFNDTGVKLWSQLLGTVANPGTFSFYDVTTDSNNDIFVTGSSRSSIGDQVITGRHDILFSKFSSNGTYQWSKLLGRSEGSYSESGSSIATGSNDYIYIGGIIGSSASSEDSGVGLLGKYNSSGQNIWTEYSSESSAYELVISPTNMIFAGNSAGIAKINDDGIQQ